MQISDSGLKNFEMASINNKKFDGSFEQLLIAGRDDSFADYNANTFDEKLHFPDISKPTVDVDVVGEFIEQSLFNKSTIQSNEGIEISQLYEQKLYALGKLSYVEKKYKFFYNSKVIYNDEKSIYDAIKPPSLANVSAYIPQLNSRAYQPGVAPLIGNERNISKSSFSDGNSSFSLINNQKYEREKITQFDQGEKKIVYVRNYFSSVEKINEIVTHLFLKFKNQINFIVNGKRR